MGEIMGGSTHALTVKYIQKSDTVCRLLYGELRRMA